MTAGHDDGGVTRRLLVLRHAKSSWDDPDLADRDRPLAARGRRAAKLLRRHLRDEGIQVDAVFCSTAVRARETWHRARPGLRGEPTVTFEPRVYEADVRTLVEIVRTAPPTARTVLLVGHNPGLDDLVHALARDGDPGAVDLLADGLRTGALATLRVEEEWSALAPGTGYLESLVRPRDLDQRARGGTGGE